VAAGAAAVLVVGRAPLRQRIADALQFGVVSAIPAGVWVLRNALVVGSSTNRDMALHLVGVRHAREALNTASGWLLIPHGAPDILRLAIWLCLVAGVAGLYLRSHTTRPNSSLPKLPGVLLVFIATYAAFLAVSISLFDANTPLDDRILLPVLVTGVIVLLAACDRAWPYIDSRRLVPATLALFALFVAGHLWRSAELVTRGHAAGLGFTSVSWQTSPTWSDVRALPAGTALYSNAPEIVYLHTRRYPRALPRQRFLMTQQPNAQFPAELAAVGRDLQEQCGVIVFLRFLTQRSMASEQDIRQALSPRVIQDRAEGVILGSPTCPR